MKNQAINIGRGLAKEIRIETIRALCEAGYGHIGGSMSIADVLGALYGVVMKIDPKNPNWDKRDWFILSKGHCGPALYSALAIKGYFPKEYLKTLNQPGTYLPSHCDRLKTPGVDMSTGSLGQGISAAAGVALAMKMQKRDNYVYCIIGDGEMQEGQVWEALQTIANLNLYNLILFVDYNKKQLDGPLESINKPFDLVAKLQSFGLEACMIKGYDMESILSAIDHSKGTREKPFAIVLDTYKGLGCSFAEQAPFNHYMVITPEMADEAIQIIQQRFDEGTDPRGDFRW